MSESLATKLWELGSDAAAHLKSALQVVRIGIFGMRWRFDICGEKFQSSGGVRDYRWSKSDVHEGRTYLNRLSTPKFAGGPDVLDSYLRAID